MAGARETYDAMAADYVAAEGNPFNALYEQPGLRAMLPPVAGRRVLDVGCGAGRTAAWLVEQGAEVVGFDASPEMLRRARERAPSATFSVGDLAAPLPFDDGFFDVAVASLVMHYLRDWMPPLLELRRVLRPGGAFAFTTHHPLADLELSPSGDYYATELVVDHWTLGEREYEVRFWRRPLSETFGAIAGAGFRIDALSEPQPLPEVRERFPDAWQQLTAKPLFLFLRLVPA